MGRPFLDAVGAQPGNLHRSAASVRAALSAQDLAPWRAAPLVAVGMGASSHALRPLVARLLAAGRQAVAIDADAPTPLGALMAVSQSGASPETFDTLVRAPLAPRLVVTNVPDSPIGHLADAVVPLDLEQDSVAYTLGYTATLQALGMLADALLEDGEPAGRWDELPRLADGMLAATNEAVLGFLDRCGPLCAADVVGAGAGAAAAGEAALLLREACRLPAGSFSTRQYLHGPIEAAGPGVAVIVVGDDREIAVAQTVAEAGAATLLITTVDVNPTPGLTVIRVPALEPTARAVLEILPVQLLAGHLAARRGLAIDRFRYEQVDAKLAASPPRRAAVGIDVGGTKIAAALVTDDGRRTLHWETAPNVAGGGPEALNVAMRLARRAALAAHDAGLEVSGIGLGLPELVDPTGEVLTDSVLPQLAVNTWRTALGNLAPVRVESDVRAAALAEALLGAGRPHPSFCYVSIGTGVSYCLVEHGRPRTGAHGAAILVGSRTLLETWASGPALRRRHVELGGDDVDPKTILERYGLDHRARQAVDEIGRELGIGVATLVNALDPCALIVGGGLGTAPGPLWDTLATSTRTHMWAYMLRDIPIHQAALSSRSGAIGAALLGLNAARFPPADITAASRQSE